MNRPDELAAAPAGAREVVTPSWRLTVPAHVTAESPLIAVPTIHPRGDRRVIRCAQDALNAGFRVRFIWLGADDQPATDPAASEVILPKARSLRQRLGVIPKLAKIAAAEPADLWHIHDLYLLPSAKRWHRRTGRNVLYDVHEYYGLVYAERLGIGGAPGRWLNRTVNRYQVRAARRLGGVNAAAEGIAELFKDAGVPVIVTLNAPLGAQFQGLEVAPFHERATKVVHIGTLNESYGMRRLLRIAAAAQARGLPHSFDFVDRFHNASEREAFEACFAELGRPSNVKLVPPRPAHQVGELLAEYGVGLAVFTKAGQNNLAQPGKLFEYSLMGLAVVATKAAAQERFLDRWAVARICPEEQIEGFVDALEELAGQASQLDGLIAERMATARQQLTWESISSPKLMSLYRQLINGAQA